MSTAQVAIWLLRAVRRMLLRMSPPFDKLAWLGLLRAEKYNRLLIEEYQTEPKPCMGVVNQQRTTSLSLRSNWRTAFELRPRHLPLQKITHTSITQL